MKMLISGKKVDSKNQESIQVFNAYFHEVIDSVPSATEEDVEQAIAFSIEGKKVWAKTPLYRRVSILQNYLNIIEKNKDEIASLMCKETGKTITECYGEFDYTYAEFKGYMEIALHQHGEIMPSDAQEGIENDMLLTVREPIGTVVRIIPFNYPIALYAHKVAPALVAGNAVIVKPSMDNPLTAIRMTEMLIEAGVPDNVAQVITGRGSVVGKFLTSSPYIDAISLTGSVESGTEAAKNASQHLHRVFLELGGNDAMIIFEDADLDLAAENVFGGWISNAGQICCGTKRYIVHKAIKSDFIAKLVEKLNTVKMGDPIDPATKMGCLISEKAALEVEKQVSYTIAQDAKCVCGGRYLGHSYFEPTVLNDVSPDMDIAKGMEVFGTIVPIIEFETFDEAIMIANATKFGLQNCIVTKNINTAIRAAKLLESGGVIVNGPSSYRTHDMPFGGHKASGIGVEGMSHTLDEMTVLKTIVLKNVLS